MCACIRYIHFPFPPPSAPLLRFSQYICRQSTVQSEPFPRPRLRQSTPFPETLLHPHTQTLHSVNAAHNPKAPDAKGKSTRTRLYPLYCFNKSITLSCTYSLSSITPSSKGSNSSMGVIAPRSALLPAGTPSIPPASPAPLLPSPRSGDAEVTLTPIPEERRCVRLAVS